MKVTNIICTISEMNVCIKIADEEVERQSLDVLQKKTKTLPKTIIYERKSFFILLVFLLITIALLIAVRSNFYLIKF